MKSFNVPGFYRSQVISEVKQFRKTNDPRKKDNTPTVVDFKKVKYYVARHFGFCYGVENAIEIAFRALEENPGKNIYLLSEMIHNPEVNKDLIDRGIRFLQDTHGKEIIPLSHVTADDVVLIPAFGASLQVIEALESRNIDTQTYNTTCPFVERVWKKAQQIGSTDHTIIIHGKYEHEETRSTFSRAARDSRAVIVIRDMEEAIRLGSFITGEETQEQFERLFANRYTPGFNVATDLNRSGVINQTTMLATETQAIAAYLRDLMIEKFGAESIAEHFADTRDTLCYATNENQDAVEGLLASDADLALVVGGYNSSNTSHLAELCEKKFPTYFINSEKEIESREVIHHYNYHLQERMRTSNFLPDKKEIRIALTSGASCPDSLLNNIINRINQLAGVDPAEKMRLYSYPNSQHEHQPN
jgi:4-hydroxy-3-methylbut-2-en-1-yl diphosphate reductase